MMAGDSAVGNRPREPRLRVEITDRDGWRKEFPLEKPLLYIGSDARNDIVLPVQRGVNVAARHLQLIALPAGVRGDGSAPGYRAINLSNQDIVIGQAGGRSLAPRATAELDDGDMVRLGDFALVFHLAASLSPPAVPHAAPVLDQSTPVRREPGPVPAAWAAAGAGGAIARAAPVQAECVGVEECSSHMGLKLSLPAAGVEPQSPLEGSIIVRNLGEEQGVQFRLEVQGIPQDCYQVGPAPILFPNVEKGVPLRLQHPRGPGVAAGRHEIRIRATAPDAYPGEEVCVTHEIEIAPYYHHTLVLTALD